LLPFELVIENNIFRTFGLDKRATRVEGGNLPIAVVYLNVFESGMDSFLRQSLRGSGFAERGLRE